MSTTEYIDVDRTLKNLETTDLTPENVDAIHAFIDHCAAEGMSEVRQNRLIYALKTAVTVFAPSDDFELRGASEAELKQLVAALNRSDYAESSKYTFKSAIKKFYRVAHDGRDQPEKTTFFTLTTGKATTVTRDDLFTAEERQALFGSFHSTRDRAFVMVMYESAARPGEMLQQSIADVTANAQGDFIFLEGLKNTPDRTNQLVRAGRVLREWLVQHPLGGELGDIADSSAPLWVKTEQQACIHCGAIPHNHGDDCDYAPDPADRLTYDTFYRRWNNACDQAGIPDNKRRPYNLRHTRLTEVATFMGYEQLNKFAGWKPGSNRAKVYVHLNNDDVNQAIRDEYGIDTADDHDQAITCPFCSAENQSTHAECRRCGRPLSLEQQVKQEEKLRALERLQELEEKGVLEELDDVDDRDTVPG